MRVVIIHGTQGSPEGNWFPWLAERATERGADAVVPAFPTPDGQSLSAWERVAEDSIGDLDSSTVLVGHSLGATFALRLLERANEPIASTFLVSGVLGRLGIEEFDRLNASFVEDAFDWGSIRSACHSFHVYSGDDDPYVPLAMGKEIASGVGVELDVVHGGGHINTEAGYTHFDRLLSDLEREFRTNPSP